jgi:DNA-binding GntR family transcriptional regulator
MIDWQGRQKTVLRLPEKSDFFAVEETTPTIERVETKFMEYILGADLKPGTILHEADLVRAFGASTSVVRELLIRFSRYGLIEKERNRHWVLRGFTREFASELFDVREMFERRAFDAFLAKGPESNEHKALIGLKPEHHRISDSIATSYLDFPRLDEDFHNIWIMSFGNRFIEDFFGLVSVIFHYHYRWNKRDERERNLHAVNQHIGVIDAVAANDKARAVLKLNEHLEDARTTLMNSVQWDESA